MTLEGDAFPLTDFRFFPAFVLCHFKHWLIKRPSFVFWDSLAKFSPNMRVNVNHSQSLLFIFDFIGIIHWAIHDCKEGKKDLSVTIWLYFLFCFLCFNSCFPLLLVCTHITSDLPQSPILPHLLSFPPYKSISHLLVFRTTCASADGKLVSICSTPTADVFYQFLIVFALRRTAVINYTVFNRFPTSSMSQTHTSHTDSVCFPLPVDFPPIEPGLTRVHPTAIRQISLEMGERAQVLRCICPRVWVRALLRCTLFAKWDIPRGILSIKQAGNLSGKLGTLQDRQMCKCACSEFVCVSEFGCQHTY